MKISPKKNHISSESMTLLKQFKEKQILSNIRYHKIFIVLLILINVGLIYFQIFYKRKINELKNLSNQHSSRINNQNSEASSKRSDFEWKFLNLIAQNPTNYFRISYIFNTPEEFIKIKEAAFNFIEKIDGVIHEKGTFFVYQNIFDSEDFETFIERISYYENLFIVIKTDNEKKFGIFYKELIIPDENTKEFKGNTTDIFLYSFDTQKTYKFIGKKEHSLKITKNELLNLGENEIIIKPDFYNNGGEINEPLKSFDFGNDDYKVLIGKSGKFNPTDLEVFTFF